MENCLQNKEVLLDAAPSPLNEYNQPYMDKVVDITVAKFLLSTHILAKNSLERRRNKL